MKIENLTGNAEDFTGNVWCFSEEETALVDVGEGDCWNRIKEIKKVDKVVITHSHHDHIKNLEKLVERFNPEIYAYNPSNLPVNAEELSEEDKVTLAGVSFSVFHTPGHKDDSICLYSQEEKVLFTGDLIFPEGSFGRTALAEGDRDLLIESIEKITGLEVERMYCGHGDAATENVESQIKRSLENAKKHEPKY